MYNLFVLTFFSFFALTSFALENPWDKLSDSIVQKNYSIYCSPNNRNILKAPTYDFLLTEGNSGFDYSITIFQDSLNGNPPEKISHTFIFFGSVEKGSSIDFSLRGLTLSAKLLEKDTDKLSTQIWEINNFEFISDNITVEPLSSVKENVYSCRPQHLF